LFQSQLMDDVMLHNSIFRLVCICHHNTRHRDHRCMRSDVIANTFSENTWRRVTFCDSTGNNDFFIHKYYNAEWVSNTTQNSHRITRFSTTNTFCLHKAVKSKCAES
jgi:hypothetical protein